MYFIVIVCVNDEMVLGVINVLWKYGKWVLEDVLVIGFDNVDFVSYLMFKFIIIDYFIREIGVMVV